MHKDIIYIEKFAHNASIITAKGEHEFRKTVKQILEELNDDLFIQCHKSYIINIRHMDSISRTVATMTNGSEIPLSKNLVKEISRKFYNYNVNKV